MLNEEAVARIIEHMNKDHADAVLLYAKAFAGRSGAETARLVSFDEKGLGILCSEGGQESECRVEFERPLLNAGEARKVLVELSGRARQRLDIS